MFRLVQGLLRLLWVALVILGLAGVVHVETTEWLILATCAASLALFVVEDPSRLLRRVGRNASNS